jgi:hypothetical protein
MNRKSPAQYTITTQSLQNNHLIECRANATKSVIEDGSGQSAWTSYFDDPIVVNAGDEIAMTLAIVNTSSAGQEVIEITDANNTGLIKVCFYYGDCLPPGNVGTIFGNPQHMIQLDSFRRYQTIVNPFNEPVSAIFDIQPVLVQGAPNDYKQIVMSNNPSPWCNFNYTDIFGGGSANIFPGQNNTLWFKNSVYNSGSPGTPIQSQPFEAIHTITVPNGFYSPANLADVINKKVNQTYLKWFKYHELVGGYSPPISGEDNAFFTRQFGHTPMNIFTLVKYPDSNLTGIQYNDFYPDGLASVENVYPNRYQFYCLADPNGITYPSDYPLLGTNQTTVGLDHPWWSPPEVLGALFAVFQFNTTSGKFEWTNLHNPVRLTDQGTGDLSSFPIPSTTTNPIFKFATEDGDVNNNYKRTVQLAEGGCGIKLKGALWDALGFNTVTDTEFNQSFIYANPASNTPLNYANWVNTYNFTTTDPFVSTQWGINNIGGKLSGGDNNAFQYIMASEDTGNTSDYSINWQANRKPLQVYFPQLNVQLANVLNQSDIIPKPRGYRSFQWNSTPYDAEGFASKVEGGYYLVQSDILGNDLTYINESGKSLPIVGVAFKNYSSNDFYFSFNAITPFLVKNPRTLRSIYVRLLNPDFSIPTNLGTKHSIIFQLTSTFQQPYMVQALPPSVPPSRDTGTPLEDKVQEEEKT